MHSNHRPRTAGHGKRGLWNETSTSRVFFSLDAETLCSVCSACKKSGFWQVICKVKRRNDVVAGEAVVCFFVPQASYFG